jgi:hypothetical protein
LVLELAVSRRVQGMEIAQGVRNEIEATSNRA